MDTGLNEYWKIHYSGLATHGHEWLDYSNPRVQLQVLALCLEAAGDTLGRVCADIGCGRGQLAGILKASGAGSVLGVDFIEELIEQNRKRWPDIDWLQGDVLKPDSMATLRGFDRIFMVEMLQYVDMSVAVPTMWRHVLPGGRLIFMVPNEECPIVGRTRQRFGERYVAVSSADVLQLANSLDDLTYWKVRGLTFREDQQITPYDAGQWTTELEFATPPNRFNVVLARAD